MPTDRTVKWPLLVSLTDDDRQLVLRAAVRRRYPSGDSLFHQGDAGDSFHLIDRGHVAIRVVSRMGEIVTLDVLSAGDGFGEQALLTAEAIRTASAVAIGPCETLMLHRDAFADLRRRHPAVADFLVATLAAQVRRLTMQILDAHTTSADQRVLKQLSRMATTFGEPGADSVTIPLTQEDLASLAGTTRPTANRALQTLVADGIIELRRGKIVVVRPDGLGRTAST